MSLPGSALAFDFRPRAFMLKVWSGCRWDRDVRKGEIFVMEHGSKFVAALMAILILQLLHPSSPQIPYWQDVSAALIGSLVAWALQVCGDRLKAWRKSRGRLSAG